MTKHCRALAIREAEEPHTPALLALHLPELFSVVVMSRRRALKFTSTGVHVKLAATVSDSTETMLQNDGTVLYQRPD